MRRYAFDQQIHTTVAFCANVAVCLTASPFRLLPEWLYAVFAIGSFVAFHLHFVGKRRGNSY